MTAFEEWLAMGGHGFYVWGAYGVALLVLAALVAASLRFARASEADLARLSALRPRARRSVGTDGRSDGTEVTE